MTGRTSTTARTLRRLRLCLFALTAVVLGLSVTVFQQVHGTVDAAARHTLPAVMAVSATYQAFAEADSDAMTAFATGTVRITGPGNAYQAQIKLAGQSLEQAAAADQVASDELLLAEQQLAEYRQGIEQAHADYASGATTLSSAEAVYASTELHDKDSGLDRLGQLQDLERNTLAGQVSSVWLTPWAAIMWIGPGIGLFALLIVTQAYVSRRFRRRINGWLVGATMMLIVLAAAMATTFWAAAGLHQAVTAVEELLHDRAVRDYQPAHVSGPPSTVAALLATYCQPRIDIGCGVVRITASDGIQDGDATAVTNAATTADQTHYLEFVVPASGLAVAVLVLVGFQRRIEEYRRRTT